VAKIPSIFSLRVLKLTEEFIAYLKARSMMKFITVHITSKVDVNGFLIMKAKHTLDQMESTIIANSLPIMCLLPHYNKISQIPEPLMKMKFPIVKMSH